jgi:cbb3-type cytochrome oxidase subunit 1
MTNRLAARFVRHAVIYALIGMCWGIYMAASQNHATHVGHAHLMLLGWVSMAIFGIAFQVWPAAAEGRLPVVQFWAINIGVVVMAVGLWLIYTGNVPVGEPLASIGSLLVLLSMILFAVNIWRGTR